MKINSKTIFDTKIIWTFAGWLLIALVIYYVLRYLFRYLHDITATTPELTEAGQNINVTDLTYTNIEYLAMATTLKTAMGGWGTDEQAIYSTLNKLVTKSDYFALYKAFGLFDNMNLTECLNDELDSSELNNVRSILSNIGIVF